MLCRIEYLQLPTTSMVPSTGQTTFSHILPLIRHHLLHQPVTAETWQLSFSSSSTLSFAVKSKQCYTHTATGLFIHSLTQASYSWSSNTALAAMYFQWSEVHWPRMLQVQMRMSMLLLGAIAHYLHSSTTAVYKTVHSTVICSIPATECAMKLNSISLPFSSRMVLLLRLQKHFLTGLARTDAALGAAESA